MTSRSEGEGIHNNVKMCDVEGVGVRKMLWRHTWDRAQYFTVQTLFNTVAGIGTFRKTILIISFYIICSLDRQQIAKNDVLPI